MKEFRPELRVFGLLLFALLGSSLGFYGIQTVNLEPVLGMPASLSGAAAVLLILLVLFWKMDLIKWPANELRAKNLEHPIEELTPSEAAKAIDELEVDRREIERRQKALREYIAELNAGKDAEGAMRSIGMRPVQRPDAARSSRR